MSNSQGQVDVSEVSASEIVALLQVRDNVQAQLDNKAPAFGMISNSEIFGMVAGEE